MDNEPEPTICRCGVMSARFTSWTDVHPGKRFERCAYLGTNRRACKHWTWIDPKMCKRSTKIIPGLLRRINGYEARVRDLEEENARLRAENNHLQQLVAQQSDVGDGISGEDVKNEIDELSARIEELRIRVGIN